MKVKQRYYEESVKRTKDRKNNLSLVSDPGKHFIPASVRSSTSSSVKNSVSNPYSEIATSPKNKPVRPTVRSDPYSKSFMNKESSRDPSSKTMRPPCRQSENVFDLDDSSKPARKEIRIVRKQARPPSRHKTPPKALGLDLPPNSVDVYSIDSTPVSFSTSVGLVEADRTSKGNRFKSQNSRAISAKQGAMPVVINKRRVETSQGSSIDGNYESAKRSTSRVKQQNQIFSNLKTEFLDLFA